MADISSIHGILPSSCRLIQVGEPVERRLDRVDRVPGSRGGRRTMMTGIPASRAAISFASVAAPPLALQTSTSIAVLPQQLPLVLQAERPAPANDVILPQRQFLRAADRSAAR